MTKALAFVVLPVAVLLSLFLLTRSDPRFHLIALIWFATCVFYAGYCTRPAAKLVFINLGVFFLLFGGTELYLRSTETSSRPPTPQEGTKATMMRQDPLLGYAPKASTTVTDRKRWGDDLMWDVTYTIDDRGLRMTPRSDDSSDCVLFFGGSFTFGSGIDDDETLAYQVAVRTPEDLRVYNFGVGGYGAHQVLTAIEHGIADQAIDCDRESVRQVIYQGIWQHAARVAGLVKWDDHGPRYALDDNGEVTFQGHFDDGLRKIWRAVAKLAIKSEIYQRVTGAGKHFRRLDEDDFDLYVALVARVRDVVRERYPCAAFDVLYWDTTEAESRAILQRFGARGFRTHRVSTILPGFYDPEEGLVYKIHPNDGHPNAFANQRLADYVMGTILPAGSSCRQAELNP